MMLMLGEQSYFDFGNLVSTALGGLIAMWTSWLLWRSESKSHRRTETLKLYARLVTVLKRWEMYSHQVLITTERSDGIPSDEQMSRHWRLTTLALEHCVVALMHEQDQLLRSHLLTVHKNLAAWKPIADRAAFIDVLYHEAFRQAEVVKTSLPHINDRVAAIYVTGKELPKPTSMAEELRDATVAD